MSRGLAAVMLVLMAAMGAYIAIDVVAVDTAESQNGITMPAQVPTQPTTINDLQKRIETLERQVADLQRQVADMKEVKIIPTR